MRIVCPSCQAAYEVPDTLLASGPKKVKCARCGNNWVPEPVASPTLAELPAREPEPEPPEPLHAPDPLPEPAAEAPALPPPPVVRPAPAVAPRAEEKLVPPPAKSAPKPGRRTLVVAGVAWAASVALLGAAAWAGFAYREQVMAAWAPSRRLYALLGLG